MDRDPLSSSDEVKIIPLMSPWVRLGQFGIGP
jgi:hypothetical protein